MKCKFVLKFDQNLCPDFDTLQPDTIFFPIHNPLDALPGVDPPRKNVCKTKVVESDIPKYWLGFFKMR